MHQIYPWDFKRDCRQRKIVKTIQQEALPACSRLESQAGRVELRPWQFLPLTYSLGEFRWFSFSRHENLAEGNLSIRTHNGANSRFIEFRIEHVALMARTMKPAVHRCLCWIRIQAFGYVFGDGLPCESQGRQALFEVPALEVLVREVPQSRHFTAVLAGS